MKKILTASFAALFAFAMCMPVFALAEGANDTDATGENAPTAEEAAAAEAVQTFEQTAREPVEPVPIADEDNGLPKPLENMEADPATTDAPAEAQAATASDPAADCTLTIHYYEIVYYDDSYAPDNLRPMGDHVVTGLKPGDVVNVWDYVVNIPGYFFFDGSRPSITISADDSQNQVDLMYAKLTNSEFTVNYYIMEGADLAADDWSGALATNPEFYKVGEQHFVDQRFDDEINGADFEFPVDGLLAVDTYPHSIHLSTNPDDNVINVIYVSELATLPDDVPIVDVPETPAPDAPGTGSGTVTPPASSTPSLPNEVIIPTPDGTVSTDPSSFGAPSEADQLEGVTLSNGQINSGPAKEPIEITDDMLANPVTPQTAERYAKAFELGTPLLSPLPVITDAFNIQLAIALLLVLLAYLAVCIYAFERGRQGK